MGQRMIAHENNLLWLASENKSPNLRDRRFSEEKYFNIIGSVNSIVYALSSDFRLPNHHNTSFHEYLAPRAKNGNG